MTDPILKSVAQKTVFSDFPNPEKKKAPFLKNTQLHQTFDEKVARNATYAPYNYPKILNSIVGMESKETLDSPYEQDKIDSVFLKILAKKHTDISFKKEKFESKKVVDGLCSAIALTTLKTLLDTPLSKRVSIYTQIAKELHEGAPQEVALIQSVFNTIVINGKTADKRLAKMQSLASVLDIDLIPMSKAIVRKKNGLMKHYFELNLNEEFNKLNQGLYCLRMLWPAGNDKKEYYGHTLALMIQDEKYFFCDAGIAFTKAMTKTEALNALKKCIQYWGGHEIRIYKTMSEPGKGLPPEMEIEPVKAEAPGLAAQISSFSLPFFQLLRCFRCM